jgi:hypothetical protein
LTSLLVQTVSGSSIEISSELLPIGLMIYCLALFVFFRVYKNSAFLFVNLAIVGGLLLSFVSVAQYIDLYGLNTAYYPFIGGDRGLKYVASSHDRALGFYGNPNEVGFVIGLVFLALISISNRQFSFRKLIAFSILLCGILASQSRTVWAAIAIALCCWLALRPIKPKKLFSILFIAIIPVGLLYGLGFLDKIFERASNLSSFNARVNNVWVRAFDLIEENWLLGVGSRSVPFATDNEIMNIWIKYGVLGPSILLVWGIVIVCGMLGNGQVSRAKSFFISLFIYLIVYSQAVSLSMFSYNPPMVIVLTLLVAGFSIVRRGRPA